MTGPDTAIATIATIAARGLRAHVVDVALARNGWDGGGGSQAGEADEAVPRLHGHPHDERHRMLAHFWWRSAEA